MLEDQCMHKIFDHGCPSQRIRTCPESAVILLNWQRSWTLGFVCMPKVTLTVRPAVLSFLVLLNRIESSKTTGTATPVFARRFCSKAHQRFISILCVDIIDKQEKYKSKSHDSSTDCNKSTWDRWHTFLGSQKHWWRRLAWYSIVTNSASLSSPPTPTPTSTMISRSGAFMLRNTNVSVFVDIEIRDMSVSLTTSFFCLYFFVHALMMWRSVTMSARICDLIFPFT